jgi:hypothetical protein
MALLESALLSAVHFSRNFGFSLGQRLRAKSRPNPGCLALFCRQPFCVLDCAPEIGKRPRITVHNALRQLLGMHRDELDRFRLVFFAQLGQGISHVGKTTVDAQGSSSRLPRPVRPPD